MDPQFKKQLDDLLVTGRAAEKIDRNRAEAFELFSKNESWKLYTELLNSKIQLFADAMLTPAGSVDGAVALEFVKGAMSGLIMARDLPSVIVGAMKASVPAAGGDDE